LTTESLEQKSEHSLDVGQVNECRLLRVASGDAPKQTRTLPTLLAYFLFLRGEIARRNFSGNATSRESSGMLHIFRKIVGTFHAPLMSNITMKSDYRISALTTLIPIFRVSAAASILVLLYEIAQWPL
jgi:hypothetical protein